MKGHLCALVHDCSVPVPDTIELGKSVLVWNATEVSGFKAGKLVGTWLTGKVSKLPGSVTKVGGKDMLVRNYFASSSLPCTNLAQ